MDQNINVGNGNQERNGRIGNFGVNKNESEEIPKHYNQQYGYQQIVEDTPMNQYTNGSYVVQNVGHGEIPGAYIDPMERQYVYTYPVYDGGIPVNTSIQHYRPAPFHIMSPYENIRTGNRVVYNSPHEYMDHLKFQNSILPNGKATHRQKKNFLCC